MLALYLAFSTSTYSQKLISCGSSYSFRRRRGSAEKIDIEFYSKSVVEFEKHFFSLVFSPAACKTPLKLLTALSIRTFVPS